LCPASGLAAIGCLHTMCGCRKIHKAHPLDADDACMRVRVG
jgi:hypothetical protein